MLNYLSLVLLGSSVVLSFRRGWSSLLASDDPEQSQMIVDLGIPVSAVPYLGALTLLIGVLLLFPRTFFLGNLLNGFCILCIMALALHGGYLRFALLEIPFLILPLLMIWLKYPFTN